jgi:pilus assembly protein CpaF
MRDPAVSELMVNGPKRIYVERAGKLSLSDRTFNDERQLRLVIERIVAPIGRRIDEASPMVDARLPDGSRVNAIIEPISLHGSALTIRRFGTHRLTMDDLVNLGSVPVEAVGFLRAIVQGKLNVLVSGGTGTGKTTFLNVLSNFIPPTDRIVTIEDAAELLLNQDHVVSLEARPANIEGKGAISIRDLVKNALRMRPDRIVVGECRGGEALDMLQAMNTGHDGSLTTLHANTARDALARLETLVLMAGFDLPIRAIREQIASAVNVIVEIARMRDGTRKLTSITEVVGMEGDIITLQEIVNFHPTGLDEAGKVTGNFAFTGVQPRYMERFEENGVDFDMRELSKLRPAEAVW